MNSNKYYLILIALLLNFSIAQIESFGCGTTANSDDIQSSISSFNHFSELEISNDREISWVPVQIHIVTRTDGTGGLNENVIDLVLNQMNEDFNPIDIRFYTISEIDYIADSDYYYCDDDIEINQLKMINNTPGVIDIYSVGSLSSNGTPLCGISSFSWFDIQGLVIANSCFDRSTMSHEMGHFFDLFHPHETATGQEYVNGTNCDNFGDGICDTPADPDLSTPGYVQACTYTGSALDPNGQEYDDCQGYPPCEYYGGPDVENIMSYAPNVCVDHFTEEQYEKMEYVLFKNREEYILVPEFSDIHINELSVNDVVGDNDGEINPGETAQIEISVFVSDEWPTPAVDLILTLQSTETDLTILNDQFFVPLLEPGQSVNNFESPIQIEVSPFAELRPYEVDLNLAYYSTVGELYETNLIVDFSVTLNQAGFPIITNEDVVSSPAVIDLDFDGQMEIIFGDFSGNIYRFNQSELDTIFSTSGQIWGSPAVTDLDFDGIFEIVVGSTDKYLYILNADGSPQAVVYTDQFLIGTPAIGNLDMDTDLEIVIGGFSNPGTVFAYNSDGSNVEGFPVVIDEKMKNGAGLADIDGDGIDEIYIGTEDDHLWKIKSNGTTVTSEIILSAEDKFRFAPVISKSSIGFRVFCGNDDGFFYSMNPDGEELVSINAQDEITSSAALSTFSGGSLFFGASSGFLYGIQLDGSLLPGFPVYTVESFSTAPVLADLNYDGQHEILLFSDSGNLLAFQLDGSEMEFDIHLSSGLKSSPWVGDLDGDSDVEILAGTENGLYGIDFKSPSTSENYWNIYRGNLRRNGFLDLTVLNQDPTSTPGKFQVTALYPNPLNGSLNIDFMMERPGMVEFKLYTISGRTIHKRKQFFHRLGVNTFNIELNEIASGQYIIEIKNEIIRDFQRITVVK